MPMPGRKRIAELEQQLRNLADAYDLRTATSARIAALQSENNQMLADDNRALRDAVQHLVEERDSLSAKVQAWEDQHRSLTETCDSLAESLDWWIAEANHRGNVILGMTPGDPGWKHSCLNDAETKSRVLRDDLPSPDERALLDL